MGYVDLAKILFLFALIKFITDSMTVSYFALMRPSFYRTTCKTIDKKGTSFGLYYLPSQHYLFKAVFAKVLLPERLSDLLANLCMLSTLTCLVLRRLWMFWCKKEVLRSNMILSVCKPGAFSHTHWLFLSLSMGTLLNNLSFVLVKWRHHCSTFLFYDFNS